MQRPLSVCTGECGLPRALRALAMTGDGDDPIIEVLNGWMKEGIYLDFDLDLAQNVPGLRDRYVSYFNNHRRHAALDYKSPVQ